MPRQPRIDLAGSLYHVIARGIERRKIFMADRDCEDFLLRLKNALAQTGNRCMAWCLMPNHFHLLILRGTRPLAELMRRLMSGYAIAFNLCYSRAGHLFQNRYKAILCEAEEYLLELIAYIHLNPLRAGLVKDMEKLEKYKWCGHGVLTGERKADFQERDYVLGYFGNKEKKAVKEYISFIAERREKYKGGEYSGGGLIRSLGGLANVLAMRKNGDKDSADERILGNGDFVEDVLRQVKDDRPKRLSHEEIMREIENKTAVTSGEIFSRSRRRPIVRARAMYCYLEKEKAGASGTELMKELQISCGAVSLLAQKGREIVERK